MNSNKLPDEFVKKLKETLDKEQKERELLFNDITETIRKDNAERDLQIKNLIANNTIFEPSKNEVIKAYFEKSISDNKKLYDDLMKLFEKYKKEYPLQNINDILNKNFWSDSFKSGYFLNIAIKGS